jgi:hypothetical protein
MADRTDDERGGEELLDAMDQQLVQQLADGPGRRVCN